jgi:hypothetical protein
MHRSEFLIYSGVLTVGSSTLFPHNIGSTIKDFGCFGNDAEAIPPRFYNWRLQKNKKNSNLEIQLAVVRVNKKVAGERLYKRYKKHFDSVVF